MSTTDSPRGNCLGDKGERTQILPPKPSRSQRARKGLARFGKRLVVFLFSQIGLTCLVVAYAVMGGFVFMTLERSKEKQSRQEVTVTRHEYVERMWNVTMSLNILHKDNWTAEADIIFKLFQEEVFKAVKEDGWDGREVADEANSEWTYAGSLLFAVTVITTIGYGHLTPRTMWGRIVLMIYAVVGIPLTLLCLANIGSLLANVFRFLYARVLCCACRLADRRRRRRQRESVTSQTQMALLKSSPAPPSSVVTQDSVYLGEPGKEFPADGDGCVKTVMVDGRGGGSGAEKAVGEPETLLAMEKVPISVCLVLVAAYLFLGAVLFSMWEPDWDYLKAAYFCFVTLSTIGFGDVVPGHTQDAWDNQVKRVGCTLYLLFGLALIATCFELMQQQVRAIFKQIAHYLGILKKDSQRTDV